MRRAELIDARKEMGLSRRQLARRIPVSLRTIQRHEGPNNEQEMSQAAEGHIRRLLDDHRKANQGLGSGKGKGKGSSKGNDTSDVRRPNDAPRRRALTTATTTTDSESDAPSPSSSPSARPVPRAFGRVGSEEPS